MIIYLAKDFIETQRKKKRKRNSSVISHDIKQHLNPLNIRAPYIFAPSNFRAPIKNTLLAHPLNFAHP